MFDRLKAFCDSFLEKGLPGFDLIIYKDGECVLRYANGYSDVENKIKMTGKERFNIYSCSKPITCTAALQLFEKGLFSLDDKISDYMPEFKEMTVKVDGSVKKATNDITIKDLFGMSSGLSYNVKTPDILKFKEASNGRCPTRETMKYIAKEPLSFEPGEKWQYSLSHDVLAALVEVITGEKFEDYVKKNIFDVLGMCNSTFMLPENELDTISPQYNFSCGKLVKISKQIVDYKIGTEYASGGAGAISTVDDYIKFLEGLRTYKLLKPETIALMTTDLGKWPSDTHGYGLGVRCPKGVDKYTDFGWGGAACSYLAVDIENAISIFFGAHQCNSPAQGLRSMLYSFARAEILDDSDFERIEDKLKTLYNYTLTY